MSKGAIGHQKLALLGSEGKPFFFFFFFSRIVIGVPCTLWDQKIAVLSAQWDLFAFLMKMSMLEVTAHGVALNLGILHLKVIDL